MESLEEYLRGYIGFKGVPLSYVVDVLKARFVIIGIHTTKHYIAKELLTSQDVRSGATERLCAYLIFR